VDCTKGVWEPKGYAGAQLQEDLIRTKELVSSLFDSRGSADELFLDIGLIPIGKAGFGYGLARARPWYRVVPSHGFPEVGVELSRAVTKSRAWEE